ncbi:MAG: polyprenyl synthetase family protein [Anaerolineae bacterium]|nr:polyprenyl synthetase family protein [Anaerolineae bacterium]
MSTASVSFTTSIAYELQLLEDRLIQAVPVDRSSVADQVKEIVRAGGKRLRPSLTIYAGRIFNAPLQSTIAVAAGLEMLHTATLIHDDLVDNAQERRGVPTLNANLPMGLVVLTGDMLFATAAKLVAEANHVEIMRDFAHTLGEICHGELVQAQTKHTLVPIEEYYSRIYGKTASLFRAAAQSGAMLGTDDVESIQMMSNYGRLLGMAFQIIDDALDFSSDAQQLGKPNGHDLREGVITLPVLLYHARQARLNGTFKRVIAGTATSEQVEHTIEDIKNSGAVDEAISIAVDFARRARESLDGLADSEARQQLLELTRFAISRDH